MKAHFQMMAAYNSWANSRLYDAVSALSEEDFSAGMGVFFGSLKGTLNHLLIGDTLWLERFLGATPSALPLDGLVHDKFSALRKAREAKDAEIITFVEGCDPNMEISYANTSGARFTQKLSPLLAHLFNHQTHHRGQCHAVLTRLAGEAPALDLIYFLREG